MKITVKYLTAAVAGVMLAFTSTNLCAADAADEKADKGDGIVAIVSKVDTETKALTVTGKKDTKEVVYTIADDVKVLGEDGKEITLATLKEGEKVRIRLDDETKKIAKRIKIAGKKDDDEKSE